MRRKMDKDILSEVHTLGNTYWFPQKSTLAQWDCQSGRRHGESILWEWSHEKLAPQKESSASWLWSSFSRLWLLWPPYWLLHKRPPPPPPNPIQSPAIHVRQRSSLRVVLPKRMTSYQLTNNNITRFQRRDLFWLRITPEWKWLEDVNQR